MRRYQPPPMPGWGPMTQPQSPPRARFRVPRPILILLALFTMFLLTGILSRPRGWLALALTWALVNNALGRGRRIRTVAEWVAVAAVVLIVAGVAPNPPEVKRPHLRAPVKVEASQTDHLEQARTTWSKAFQQWAQAFSEVGKDKEAAK